MLQRTDEWRKARLGYLTASGMVNLTKTDGATRSNYRAQIITERLTGLSYEGYVSAEMTRGADLEASAKHAYSERYGYPVVDVGFVPHPTITWFGASPDALVGQDGLVEVKCPNTATHLSYWLEQKVPTKYQPQMLAQLACTGRKWCDFVSFDPRLPEDMALFCVRFTPTADDILEVERRAKEFLIEIEHELLIISHRRGRT